MKRFEYLKPSTMEETSEMLIKYGDGAKILNGGTDILVRMRDGFINPDYVVDIKNLPGMKSMEYTDEGELLIGSAVTLNELLANDDFVNKYYILAQSAHEVGSFQLRNRASLAGNVCNASPSGDTLPALYVLGAKIRIYTGDGVKSIPLEDFILGVRKTALNTGEFVTGIILPKLKEGHAGAFYKHSRRKDVDLATVSAAVFYCSNHWRVCFGAVAPTPLRGRKVEGELNKLSVINEASLAPVLEAAASEISPISDVRASREYRIEMIKVVLKRAVLEAYRKLEK